MEFDINLVLVPVTLALLAVWLFDKFWLKQHRELRLAQKKQATIQKNLNSAKKALEVVLVASGLPKDVDAVVIDANSPKDLVEAHQAYYHAKRELALATVEVESVNEIAPVRWAYEFLPILLAIVLIRSFVAEPFNIPSSSMVPSLYTGDFIVVNKTSYGLRLPLTHTKILDTGSPERGDVAVFRFPLNENRYYIKRVIGLPGDTVAYDNGVLSINGQAVQTQKYAYQMPQNLTDKIMPEQIGTHRLSGEERAKFGREEESHAHYYQEVLGNHRYTVRYVGDLNASAQGDFLQQQSPEVVSSQGKTWQIVVPQGQYFVMGDNRDRSEDSRFWGFVPEKNLSGKATYIWMHKEPGLKLPSFGRVGAID